MNGTNRLVFEYSTQQHPLATGISMSEADALIDELRKRLSSNAGELDISPASLKRLEQKLVAMYQSLQKQNKLAATDVELFQLSREIAAYLGLVLVNHAGGTWRTLGTLWGTEIVLEGPIKVIDGRKSYMSPYPTVISLGNVAANAWHLIVQGEHPNFYKVYRRAKRKVSKQEL